MTDASPIARKTTPFNALPLRQRATWFAIIVIVGWFIRMADPFFGVLFSMYYIFAVRTLYAKADYKEFLGFNRPSRSSIGAALAVVGIMVAVFFPFYLASPLCPMHLFDPILGRVHPLLGASLPSTILVMFLAIGTFSVYAEELFFRAFVQDAIDGFAGLPRGRGRVVLDRRRAVTLLWSNLLFGIAHVNLLWDDIYSWGSTPPDLAFISIGVLSLAGAGYLFGILRVKYDSTWVAVIAHCIGNFFQAALPAIVILG